jgi:hypothetical protein
MLKSLLKRFLTVILEKKKMRRTCGKFHKFYAFFFDTLFILTFTFQIFSHLILSYFSHFFRCFKHFLPFHAFFHISDSVCQFTIGKIPRKLCEQKGIEIIEAELCPDHIHKLIAIPSKYSVAQPYQLGLCDYGDG